VAVSTGSGGARGYPISFNEIWHLKAVILAGGLGTRISEDTVNRPKPILWHIMKIYSVYRVDEFAICCGYKDYVIKE